MLYPLFTNGQRNQSITWFCSKTTWAEKPLDTGQEIYARKLLSDQCRQNQLKVTEKCTSLILKLKVVSLICKLRHATRSQSEQSHFNAKTRNVLSLYQFTVAEQTLTIMKCKQQAYLGKCRIRRKSSKLETGPLGFVQAGAELPTLCPFSTEDFLIWKKFPHYNQEVSSVVKEELISTHSGKVQFQLFHRWAIARY